MTLDNNSDNNLNFNSFKERRKRLIESLKTKNPDLQNGLVILFGDFENDRYLFRQNSNFYSLTGISEPGAVLFLYFDGSECLYLPSYKSKRENWVSSNVDLSAIREVKSLGKPFPGYSFNPIFTADEYENVLADLKLFLKKFDVGVFALLNFLNPKNFFSIYSFRFLVSKLPRLKDVTYDLSPILENMRSIKDRGEIVLMQKAINTTIVAQNAATRIISPGVLESDVLAVIESVFISRGSVRPAFPSIIATGKNATILHYMDRNQKLKDGDLVVVDIGAEVENYAADITRTYPVNGKFSKRQTEIYSIVLDVQKYVALLAKPGMFLNNPSNQEKSLHHLALNLFKEYGYDNYFIHGIGHYLGLDVHDDGSYERPLCVGNVFTIEPGLYIPEENLGIRIEDDYVVVEDGVVCLSDSLPKQIEEIEALINKNKN